MAGKKIFKKKKPTQKKDTQRSIKTLATKAKTKKKPSRKASKNDKQAKVMKLKNVANYRMRNGL